MTFRAHLGKATKQLRASSTTPMLDAEILLAFAAKKERVFFVAHDDEKLLPNVAIYYEHLVQKRMRGVPIAYLVGEKEFYGRMFTVNPAVFIPRPETELLVETTHNFIAQHHLVAPNILDIGTGSGCLAVTLKKEFPTARVVAVDVARDALSIAKKNAKRHNVDISFFAGDLFAGLPKKMESSFDCILTNPPYVERTIPLTSPETQGLRFEPSGALFPRSDDSMSMITRIINETSLWLRGNPAPTLLAIEIGANQGKEACKRAREVFPHHHIHIQKDNAGFDRVLVITDFSQIRFWE